MWDKDYVHFIKEKEGNKIFNPVKLSSLVKHEEVWLHILILLLIRGKLVKVL